MRNVGRPSGKIVFVGWPHPLVSVSCMPVRLPPAELENMSLADCRAVVLGIDAIVRLDPRRTEAALAPMRGRVVICIDDCAATTLWPWARLGFMHVVARSELPRTLGLLSAHRPRPSPSFGTWLPRVPQAGSPAFLAAALVTALDALTVGDWARALGWSRGRLLKTCKTGFGVTAKQALQRFLVVAFDELRRDGATWQACSEILGYSDPSSLRDALRAAAATRNPSSKGASSPCADL